MIKKYMETQKKKNYKYNLIKHNIKFQILTITTAFRNQI